MSRVVTPALVQNHGATSVAEEKGDKVLLGKVVEAVKQLSVQESKTPDQVMSALSNGVQSRVILDSAYPVNGYVDRFPEVQQKQDFKL